MRHAQMALAAGLTGIALAAASVASPALAAPSARGVVRLAPKAASYRVIAKAGAVTRSGPGGAYTKGGTLRYGAVVTGTGKVAGGWIQIKAPAGMRPWVEVKNLAKIVAPPPKPVLAVYRTAAALRLRSGPGNRFPEVGALGKNGIIVATGRSAAGAGAPAWTEVALSTGARAWAPSASLARTKLPLYRVAVAPGMNIRSAPSVTARQVGFLKTGILAPGTGKTIAGWIQLSLSPGGIVWGSSRYLAPVIPKAGQLGSTPAQGPTDTPNPPRTVRAPA